MAELVEEKKVATETLTINGKTVSFFSGETILEVARRSGIYIPTLCARADLPSMGSCRLCVVKVDGVRGYVTSCTTPATPNMVVTTNSDEIEKLRREILELILSEHPSACLVCSIRESCEKFRASSAKTGRVTGCNMCPNRDICELRQLVEYLGLKEIRYPFLYKNFPLERDDPFMDRDYNLCILCGRCIRVCQENLGLSAISFIRRGHDTKVGTSFEKLHVDGNCVFCMHCVDVCPTGALTVRGSKWYGYPDSETPTTCILCERGCELVIDTMWNKVMGAHPIRDMSAGNREYCVKGRCCLPALFNSPDRLKYPSIRRDDGKIIYTDWDNAMRHVSQIVSHYSPKEIGILCSRHLTDESIYALNEFARVYAESNIFYFAEGGIIFPSIEKSDEIFKDIKILYLAEANSFSHETMERFGSLENIIIQDIYPSALSRSDKVCAVFPATVFTEMNGTKTCADNRREAITKAAEPPGKALPDWDITVQIGNALNNPDFRILNFRSIQSNIQMHPWIIAAVPMVPKDSLTYRGFPIADFVPDFRIFVEGRLRSKGEIHF
ncbi:MAG TPA: 2Fe-2S iron-sulfur cluster-binding protein [Desulfatiglandales bacterium]|nr:2Fe-2S iron-sulfur cluster-binding protein [Desulfatiglandales bacterium]